MREREREYKEGRSQHSTKQTSRFRSLLMRKMKSRMKREKVGRERDVECGIKNKKNDESERDKESQSKFVC